MPVVVFGASLLGVDALRITVEVDLLRKLPQVVMVGLPAPSVRESADRVRSALLASDLDFPKSRVVVSLAPADVRKEGTALDLCVAVGLLAASDQVPEARARDYLLVGELSLTGELRPVRGTLAFACLAKELGLRGIILPAPCAPEAALVEGIEVRAASTLREVVAFLNEEGPLPLGEAVPPVTPLHAMDLSEIRGQLLARQALEVAAAGGHNLLLEGTPGCGKTMLAARLPSILPRMTLEEALACTRIHSVAGLHPPDAGVMFQRPFRAPHHSISTAGLIGTASLQPGEVSLAHQGVLFLDEFPEFPRQIRELLRGPLEDRHIAIARAAGRVTLPASFMLIAAANPCPCGWWGHPTRPCVCSEAGRLRYRARLSGPLIDRIDLRVELQPVTPAELLGAKKGESSAAVRARVERARAFQQARYQGAVSCNAELQPEQLMEGVSPTPAALRYLQDAMEVSAMSARVGRRLLKVARTLADLDASERVHPHHLQLAVALRCEVEARRAA